MRKIKYTLILLLSISFVNGILFYSIFKFGERSIFDELKSNLKGHSRFLMHNIEDRLNFYKDLIENKKTEQSKEYKEIFSFMNEDLSRVNDIIKFNYTIYKENNKILFGVDAISPGDADSDGVEDHAQIHSEYDLAPEILLKNYDNRKDFFSDVYSDNWGSFISYYYPIFYKEQFLGYMALDMDVNKAFKNIQNFKVSIVGLFLLVQTMIFAFSWIFYLYLSKVKDFYNQKQELEFARISKFALIGELSSFVTHEINNPLQVISSNLEIIKLSAEANPELKVSEIIDDISSMEETGNKISEIIKDMKNIMKSDSLTSTRDISIKDLILMSEKMYLKNIIKNDIKYIKEGEENLDKVNVHPIQIQQVLMNLVNNSAYEVSKLSDKWIKLKIEDGKDFIKIKVIDSGLGLSEAIQKKIQTPYYTSKPNGEGSGIGLSICRKIIEKHGGSFRYNPNEGNTCFEFTLKKSAKIFSGLNKNVA